MSGHFERRLLAVSESPRYDDRHSYASFQRDLGEAKTAWKDAASDPGWKGNAVAAAEASFNARASQALQVQDQLAEMTGVTKEINSTLDDAYNLYDSLPSITQQEAAIGEAFALAVASGPSQIPVSQDRIRQAVQALESARAARETVAATYLQTIVERLSYSQARIVTISAMIAPGNLVTYGGKGDDTFGDLDHASDMSYDKLVEWTSSKEFQTIWSAARNNPSLFNDLLKNALGARNRDFASILALIFNAGSSFNGGASAAAAFKLYENFRSGDIWDMKIYLAEEYGRSADEGTFELYDSSGRRVRSDVFGNVNYGAMMASLGVSQETALSAANAGGETGRGDDSLDDRAVKFGYELYRKYPNGMTKEQYREEIANAGLSG